MSNNKFVIWKAWIALPVVGLMLGGLYFFEALDWVTDRIKQFFFETAEAAYVWCMNKQSRT